MSITIVNLSMFFQNSNGEKRQKLLQSVSDYKQANNYQCALSAGLDQSGPVYLGCSNTNTTNNLNIQGHSLEGCCHCRVTIERPKSRTGVRMIINIFIFVYLRF